MGRKTKRITYSLADRGREHTGQDRSNVDVAAMVQAINSPRVQELVSTGSLLGYYGHQIRQRYGMWPPETAIINGNPIRLEPAIRTVELSADPDGTVSHVEEFLDNDAGEHAFTQYKARIGGFSVASDYKQQGNKLVPSDFAGFDYVWQPNFVGNAGHGLYDSIHDESIMAVLAPHLENQIAQLYDSMHRESALQGVLGQSLDRIAALELEAQQRRQRERQRAIRQAQRQEEIFDSMLCPTKPFDPAAAEAFLHAHVEQVTAGDEKERENRASIVERAQVGLSKLFGRG